MESCTPLSNGFQGMHLSFLLLSFCSAGDWTRGLRMLIQYSITVLHTCLLFIFLCVWVIMCVVYQCIVCGLCAYVFVTMYVYMYLCTCAEARGGCQGCSSLSLTYFFEPRATVVAGEPWPSCPCCVTPQCTCSCAESWGQRETLAVLLLT